MQRKRRATQELGCPAARHERRLPDWVPAAALVLFLGAAGVSDPADEARSPQPATDPTNVPIDSTNARIDSTSARIDSTSARIDSTSARIDSTSAWVDSTRAVETDSTTAVIDSTSFLTDATRASGLGLWAWVGNNELDRGPLYAHANAQIADSVYYNAGFTAVSVSDTVVYSYFVPERWRLKSGSEPISSEVSFDPETRIVTRTRFLGGEPFGASDVYDPAAYARRGLSTSYRSQWVAGGLRHLAAGDELDGRRGLLDLSLPAMPTALQGIFGSGKSTLSVSGSEKISLGGTSRWFPYKRDNALSSNSKFPDLDMKQELFLKLQGTIGDKVHVDIDQNSNAETSLENRIKIRYEGYDDDVVQRVNLGNTSLSLPSTRFVSYGGRHEGLFGISAEGQLGPVKLTTIASKQESEAATRSVPSTTSANTPLRELRARDYIRRQYFFLDNPNRVLSHVSVTTADGVVYPDTSALVPINIDPANIKLYKDDLLGANNPAQNAFEAYVTPTGYPPCACAGASALCDTTFADLDRYETFHVFELTPQVDYVVHANLQDFNFTGIVIELTQPLGDNELLCAAFQTSTSSAVYSDVNGDGVFPDIIGTFDRNRGDNLCSGMPTFRMIAPPLEVLSDELLTDGPWKATHNLEARNFYRLGGRNIKDLNLEVFWDDTGGLTKPTNFAGEPYIEITGLDVELLRGTRPEPGQDGEVDERLIDRDRGILHFPQLRPFAPDSVDVQYRRSLTGLKNGVTAGWPAVRLTGVDPLAGNFPETEIYDRKATVFRLDSDTHVDRYLMRGEFSSPINTIELNQFNILEGSEQVTAGGRVLQRGQDYDIDYEFGVVTIKESANVRPDEEVNVTFSFAPTIGSASRTLLGVSSSLRPEGGSYGISSTWLYESKGNPERRVRLGEEPTHTVIGEMAGDYKAESAYLTDLLGRLPFYTPASRSQITMSGALGVSFPNPNTKGQAYIDDFDASRDARELNLAYRSWEFPSVPQDLVRGGLDRDAVADRRGNMVWYAPRRAALRGDLNPELSSEERDDAVRVLEWWLLPNQATTGGDLVTPEENWFGLTQAISRTGEDFSTAQFVDIWVNDFNDPDVFTNGTLYLDIGEVSEDAVWWETGPQPQGSNFSPPVGRGFEVLDTEDHVNIDGKLDECSDRLESCNEDTGLDGRFDGVPPADPSFDDWEIEGDRDEDEDDPDQNLRVFRHINGAELNSAFDTEDLDADLQLDQRNNYATYRFQLASEDTNFVVTDVQRDYGDRFPIDAKNGWRQIRIPLGRDFEWSRTGTPDLSLVKHVRLWVQGVHAAKPLQIGAVEFVGNRWLTGAPIAPILDPTEQPADPSELAPGQKFAVSVVNNKDNGDIYEPAFDLKQSQDRQGDEFEAYLSLDLLAFPDGYSGTCYRRFAQDQDYTRYNNIEFYVQAGRPARGNVALEFFMRFGDTQGTSYYEYRKKLTPDDNGGKWGLVKIPLEGLSSLKATGAPFVKERQEDGSWYIVRGAPSLTRVRQITLGVKNVSGGFVQRASVWVNELRLDEVQRNSASASHFQVNTVLSDLGSANFSFDGRNADFLQVGDVRGVGTTSRRMTYDTTINADRFMPRLNLRVPVSLSYSNDVRKPKFRTGTDIRYRGDDAELNEQRNLSRRFHLSYSRTPSRSPWLRYTLDGLNGSYDHAIDQGRAPEAADSTTTKAATLAYTLTVPRHGLLRLPLGLALDYLPGSFSASTGYNRSTRVSWTRSGSDLTKPLVEVPTISTRQRSLTWSSSYRALEKPQLGYQISSTRDLEQEGGRVLGVDLGSETSRAENLNASWNLSPMGKGRTSLGRFVGGFVNSFLAPLRPSVNWSGRFNGQSQASRDVEAFEDIPHAVSNSSNPSFRATLPLARMLTSFKRSGRETKVSGPDENEPDENDEAAPREGAPRRPQSPTGRRPGGGPRGGHGTSPAQAAAAPKENARGPLGFKLTFQDVSGEYSVVYENSHTLVDRFPGLAYQLGLARDLDSGVQRLPTNTSSDSDGRAVNFNTGVRLGSLRVGQRRLGGTYDLKITYTRNVTDKTQTTLVVDGVESAPTLTHTSNRRWPDLQLSAAGVESGIGFLEKRFRRLTLTSHYTRSNEVSGDQNEPRRSEQVRTEWSPFFSIETSTKGGMRLSLRSNRQSAETTQNGLNKSVTKNTDSDVAFSLQHSIDRKRTVSMPFGRGQKIINTRIDVGVNVSLRKTRNATRSAVLNFSENVSVDSRTLSVALNSGYNFTQSISGTAVLKYDENKDNKTRSATSRSLSMTVSAAFSF